MCWSEGVERVFMWRLLWLFLRYIFWRHMVLIDTLRPRPNGRYFADDIIKCIFLNENAWISLTISLKFVPKVRINKIPSLVQIMAWRRPGDKPLSEPMMVKLPTHVCVTRPQWVKMILHVYVTKMGSNRSYYLTLLSYNSCTYFTFRSKPRRSQHDGCDFVTTFSNALCWKENACVLIQISLKFVPKGLIEAEWRTHASVI